MKKLLRTGFISYPVLPTLGVILTLAVSPIQSVLAAAVGGDSAPNFGSNVIIFDPSMSTASIQSQINNVYGIEQYSEFGSQRYALIFKPGSYRGLAIPVGFYTQVLGLGGSPDDTAIIGNLHSDAYLPDNNANCNFWRGAEGLAVTPVSGTLQWAVSQAAPFRRMHVHGNMALGQNKGLASGG